MRYIDVINEKSEINEIDCYTSITGINLGGASSRHFHGGYLMDPSKFTGELQTVWKGFTS